MSYFYFSLIQTLILSLATAFFSCEKRETKTESIDFSKQLQLYKLFDRQLSEQDYENQQIFDSLFLNSNVKDKYHYEDANKKKKLILNLIQETKNEIINEFGGWTKKATFRRIENDSLIQNYFINRGKGNEIKRVLNEYSNDLRALGLKIDNLAVDADKMPMYKKDPKNKNKGFTQIYFEDANLIDVLNALNLIELKVLNAERFLYLRACKISK